MTTSKGTIQGYNGVASVDKKHQLVIDAQAFGEGQEHHTLKRVIENIKQRFADTHISEDIINTGVIITADTGFANEVNMKYLHQNGINAYIPDNQFRSKDPKFKHHKVKYGKRHQDRRTTKKNIIPASNFDFDPMTKTCICPAGISLSPLGEREDKAGNSKIFFEGRLSQCKACISPSSQR